MAKICKRGHISSTLQGGRYASGSCKECEKAHMANWYVKNIERHKARQTKWRAENIERKSALNAKWRVENIERDKARLAKWRADSVGFELRPLVTFRICGSD